MSAETVQQDPVAVLGSRLDEIRNELISLGVDHGVPDPGAASSPALVRDLEQVAGIQPDTIDVPAGAEIVVHVHHGSLSTYEYYRQWAQAEERTLPSGTRFIEWTRSNVRWTFFRPRPAEGTEAQS